MNIARALANELRFTPVCLFLALSVGCGDDAHGVGEHSNRTAGAGAAADDTAGKAGGGDKPASAAGGGHDSAGASGEAGVSGSGGARAAGMGAGAGASAPRAGSSAGGAGASAMAKGAAGQGGAHDAGAAAESAGSGGSTMLPQNGRSQPSAASGNGAAGQAAADMPPKISNTVVSIAFGTAPAGNPTPLVLFDGGYATWDETILATQAIDVAASMQAMPNMWEQWRRSGNEIQLKSSQGWNPLPYSDEYGPTMKGTRLSAVYERVFSPDPTAEVLVLLEWRYRFKSDGTFEYCYTSTIAGTPPVFSKERKSRAGKYEVDGYVVHFDDDAGVSDTESFIYNSASTHWLWVDDEPLELTKDTGQSVCD